MRFSRDTSPSYYIIPLSTACLYQLIVANVAASCTPQTLLSGSLRLAWIMQRLEVGLTTDTAPWTSIGRTTLVVVVNQHTCQQYLATGKLKELLKLRMSRSGRRKPKSVMLRVEPQLILRVA